MPPFLLMSSAIISAAAFPGTPKTEAGPDRNVVMPILISAGFPCARTEPASNTVATPAASAVFRNRIAVLPGYQPRTRPWRPSGGATNYRRSALQAVMILRHYQEHSDEVNGSVFPELS